MRTDWTQSFSPANLPDGQVHIWSMSIAGLAGQAPALSATLSTDEQSRAARFHFEKDRLRFIVARGGLRSILARYLDDEPRAIEFAYGQNGKPQLRGASTLQFNLSHSADVVLCGVTINRDLGVDVEKLEPVTDMDAIARRVFLREELDALEQLSGDAKQAEFYRIWTRGEALLKWSGAGLVEPDERRRIAGRFSGLLTELPCPPGYAAAIAVSGLDVQLCHFTLKHEAMGNPSLALQKFA